MAQSLPAAQANPPQLSYVDRPEISETFADSLWRVTFDNMVLKLEFVVNRMDDPSPTGGTVGRATTSARVVVSLPGMIDMLGKLQAIMGQLQAAGIIRQIQQPPTGGKPN